VVTRRKKKDSWHHGDLRRVLLDTGLRVVEKDGVSALNLRELAQKAGVSSGAPYHHFTNRQALLVALAEEGFARLRDAMASAQAAAAPAPVARLEALGRAYVEFALSQSGYFRLMFRADLDKTRHAGVNAESDKAFRLLEEAIAECQRAGLAPGVQPEALALTLWSAVHGAACLWVDGPLRYEFRGFARDSLPTVVPRTLTTAFSPDEPVAMPKRRRR
jgi:AcrR family transcriptional regulator